MSAFIFKNRLSWLGIVLSFALISIGCDNSASDSKVSLAELEEIFEEIRVLSESVDCLNASGWSITDIGSKACGGPAGYIAFSNQIDTVAFLDKIKTYRELSRQYNEENGVISDCAVEVEPVGLICNENKPILIYNRCELNPEVGPCEAAIPKYYFNQETQLCEEFLWGGCEGVVPFNTLEECLQCQ